MANRQILWRRLAERFGGNFTIRTGARQSAFYLDAEIEGTAIEVRGKSIPYSLSGGTTKIRAIAERSLGVILRVNRFRSVRSWFVRDVIVGDECFDRDWVIQSDGDAQAQAFLGREQRRLIDAVPDSPTSIGLSMPRTGVALSRHYAFEARGRVALAKYDGFETDEERLLAAIHATVGLAKRPKSLLEQWRQLAEDLSGRLELGEGWSDDGSTRIVLALGGCRIIVSPIADKLGWRRLRLRTRIYCESGQGLPAMHYSPGDTIPATLSSRLARVIESATIVVLRCDGQRVWIDLDGNVCNAARIQSAAQVIALLAVPTTQIGPYR